MKYRSFQNVHGKAQLDFHKSEVNKKILTSSCPSPSPHMDAFQSAVRPPSSKKNIKIPPPLQEVPLPRGSFDGIHVTLKSKANGKFLKAEPGGDPKRRNGSLESSIKVTAVRCQPANPQKFLPNPNVPFLVPLPVCMAQPRMTSCHQCHRPTPRLHIIIVQMGDLIMCVWFFFLLRFSVHFLVMGSVCRATCSPLQPQLNWLRWR